MPEPEVVRRLFCALQTCLCYSLILTRGLLAADVDFDSLDSYVEEGMSAWSLTGLALAVVKGDTVVVAKGFGTRRYGHDEPIDEHTIFAVASCSKPITATSLAILVDEGQIRWDEPIRTYIPTFRLKDPVASEHVSVKDFLCHRSGLGGGMFYYSTLSRKEVVAKVPSLKPVNLFRTQYRYSNINFVMASEVVPAVTAKS